MLNLWMFPLALRRNHQRLPRFRVPIDAPEFHALNRALLRRPGTSNRYFKIISERLPGCGAIVGAAVSMLALAFPAMAAEAPTHTCLNSTNSVTQLVVIDSVGEEGFNASA